MIDFRMKLAGIPIGVHALFDSTRDFCKEYKTEETPLFSVDVTQDNIEKMRQEERQVSLIEGRTVVEHSEKYLETLALAEVILKKLIQVDVVMMHGSVMAYEGKAYLFTAKSGIGKTTHSRLWLENIPDCHILNGDKPLLLFKDGRIYACGSPWTGKEHYGVNEMLPLEAICLLKRDETNRIEKIELKDACFTLLNQCHIPSGNGNTPRVLRSIQQLSKINLYCLHCNMNKEAALVSYRGMVNK